MASSNFKIGDIGVGLHGASYSAETKICFRIKMGHISYETIAICDIYAVRNAVSFYRKFVFANISSGVGRMPFYPFKCNSDNWAAAVRA